MRRAAVRVENQVQHEACRTPACRHMQAPCLPSWSAVSFPSLPGSICGLVDDHCCCSAAGRAHLAGRLLLLAHEAHNVQHAGSPPPSAIHGRGVLPHLCWPARHIALSPQQLVQGWYSRTVPCTGSRHGACAGSEGTSKVQHCAGVPHDQAPAMEPMALATMPCINCCAVGRRVGHLFWEGGGQCAYLKRALCSTP